MLKYRKNIKIKKGIIIVALIKCIECNHEVSEFAENCPNCGCPVAMSITKKNINNKYSVILTSCGESKVKLIKQIRDITGYDLSTAKNIVDNLSIIKANCSMDEANYIKKLIENEGASVDIVPYTPSHENENKHIPKCPKCGCTEFVPLRKKFSLFTGFATNKVDMVCKNCGTVRK